MPTRPPLTPERIAQAAFDLVEEVGVEGLTMRALGKRLGVDPMAVYHHLPNKEAVFDAIVETLWQGVVKAALPGKAVGWQARLTALFGCVRAHLLAHPRAALLMGTRPASTPALMGLIEATLAQLEADELPAFEAMPLMDCLMAFTVGKVLGEVSQREQQAKVVAALQSLTPQTHPHLIGALAGGYAFEPDQQFERGLSALIEGWKLDRRGAPGAGNRTAD